MQLSAAIDDTTQQQRYLDAQQQQAKHADEEALAQADVGTQAMYSSSSSFRTSGRLSYCHLLRRLYSWLAPSWPSHQALPPVTGPSAGRIWRCELFTLRASGQSPKHHPFIHVACLQLACRPSSLNPSVATLQQHSIAPAFGMLTLSIQCSFCAQSCQAPLWPLRVRFIQNVRTCHSCDGSALDSTASPCSYCPKSTSVLGVCLC